MLVYIDFEANAITEEIISIGAVSDDGRKFYSLVRPHSKLDHKIKELTGITQEEAEQAPTMDQVMVMFTQFLFPEPVGVRAKEGLAFINYGSMDTKFLQSSINYSENPVTTTLLSNIKRRLVNIDKQVSAKFRRPAKQRVGLRSAYLTMRGVSAEETPLEHNALGDAEMLKYVHEHIDEFELPDGVEPVKVPKINMAYGKTLARDPKFEVAIHCVADSKRKGHREWDFPTIYAALCLLPNTNTVRAKERGLNAIYNACVTGEPYCGKYYTFAESNS